MEKNYFDATKTKWLGDSLALFIVLAITFALFSPVRAFQFSCVDDSINIFHNPYICYPDSQNIGVFWTQFFYRLYTPITYTIWALLARIAPLTLPQATPFNNATTVLNASVYHTANLILHLANTTLVYALLRRLDLRPWACAGGTLIFAIHPMQVESVAWITGMNNLTSGLFGLLALHLYLQGNPQTPSRQPQRLFVSRWLYVMATIAFTCALLSKPTAVAIPPIAAIWESYILQRPLRKWIRPLSLWLLLALGCAETTHLASMGIDVWSPIWGRFFVAGDALAFSLGKFIWPVTLPFDYARTPRAALTHGWGFVTWIVPALIFAALRPWAHWAKRLPVETHPGEFASALPSDDKAIFCAAALIFVAGLLPTLGFVPFYGQLYSTVADRYLYLALLGPSIAVALLLSRARRALGPVPVAVCVALTGFAALTALQVPVWTNASSLTQHVLALEPDSCEGHQLLGILLYLRHDYSGALNQYYAVRQFMGPDAPVNNHKIAAVLVEMGRYDEAVAPLLAAIAADPTQQEQWQLLYFTITRIHRFDIVQQTMAERLRKDPHDGRAKFTLGVILIQRQLIDQGIALLEEGAQEEPDFADIHLDLGKILEKTHQTAEARAQYALALQIDPGSMDARDALQRLSSR